jgi:hypothetical protein
LLVVLVSAPLWTFNSSPAILDVLVSALTKTTNKAGELLKIKKGDKGLVRGVKDLYKMGKDTRNSANALYEAGKITREVHDKLVKGTKDFFGGVKESGKATKRVVNALKPGGKLVAQAKKFNGVNYDLIPKNIRGELAKVSTDGGKSKTFKFDYNKIPKDLTKKTPTRFRAPGTDNPRKDPSRPKKQTFKTKAKDRLKSVKSHFKKDFKKTVNQGKNLVNNLKSKPNQLNLDKNATKVTNPTVNRALQIGKSLNPRFSAGGLKALGGGLLQGAKGYGVGSTLDWAAQSLLDRGMRNVEGKQKMSIDDYRALKDKRFKDLQSRSTWWGGVKDPTHALKMASQPQRITNSRGRTVRTIQPEQTGGAIGRSRQEPYINREPQVSYKPEKVIPGPNTGTDSTKKETVDKVKIKKVKLNPNVPDMGYDTKKTEKKTDEPSKGFSWKPGMSERQIQSQIKTLKRKKTKASHALKIRRMERALAIKRAYGNINDKRVNQLLNKAATERELEES